MLWKKGKQENIKIMVTPEDYVLALEEHRGKDGIKGEVQEIGEQIRTFEKRSNDLHIISFREFAIDDDLITANQIVDGMQKKLYQNVKEILTFFSEEGEEEKTEKQMGIRKRICNSDMILSDLTSLLSYVLKVEETQAGESLSEIQDVLSNMEEIYINELTEE